MGGHAADEEVQRAGCGALQNMAAGSDACKRAIVGAGGLAALVAAGTAHPPCHAPVSVAVRHLLGDLGAFAPAAPAPPPPPPSAAVVPLPTAAELAEAERARQRAEQRAQQEQAQREEAEQRARASQQGQHGLQQQLTAAQQTLARLQAENAQLRAASQSARTSAIDRLVDTVDSSSLAGGTVLSVAAGPLAHFNSQYQSVRRRCYSGLDIWPAVAPPSPFGVEVTMLRRLWAEGGRGRRAGPIQETLPMGFTLTRIEAIDVPASDRHAFYNLVEQMDSRRSSGAIPGPFNPVYPGGDRTGEKAAVFAQLRARFLPRDKLQNQNIMLALHGCSHEVSDSVCRDGFAVVPYRDEPWFGRGLYLTTYAEYACRYATGEFKEQRNPPNSAGEHVLIAAFVAPGMVYPVSRTPDYERPSNLTSKSKLKDRALQPQFNSHYAFVSAAHNYECMDGARDGTVMDYDELVCETQQQALPAYRLYFSAPTVAVEHID
uniref:PARP catalytic domain-containing protein n=1 Tax=Emiliania huxleyi TaxID=2903 RepID=A0A7S3WKK6_EMIHU